MEDDKMILFSVIIGSRYGLFNGLITRSEKKKIEERIDKLIDKNGIEITEAELNDFHKYIKSYFKNQEVADGRE